MMSIPQVERRIGTYVPILGSGFRVLDWQSASRPESVAWGWVSMLAR